VSLKFQAVVRKDFGVGQFQEPRPGRSITDTTIAGKPAIRFDLLSGELYSGTHRCEAIVPGREITHPYYVREGSVRWIRYGLWIPSAASNWIKNGCLNQIRSYPETAQPFFGLIAFTTTRNSLLPSGVDAAHAYTPPFDRWIDVLMRVKHSQLPQSEADIYFDGRLIWQSRGKVTIGDGGGYMKVGVYGQAANGPVTDRWIAINNLRIGTIQADVGNGLPVPVPAADRIKSVEITFDSGRVVKL